MSKGQATTGIVVLVALVLAACAGGGDDAKPTSAAPTTTERPTPPTTTERQTTSSASTPPTEIAPTTTLPAPPTTAGPSPTEMALTNYLREGFGAPGYEQPWFAAFQGVHVEGPTVTASTTLTAGTPDLAGSLCSAISGFVFNNTNAGLGLSAVRVLGEGGVVLIERLGLADRCEP